MRLLKHSSLLLLLVANRFMPMLCAYRCYHEEHRHPDDIVHILTKSKHLMSPDLTSIRHGLSMTQLVS